MPVVCPKCGSRFLRDSKPRSPAEKMRKWWFMSPLRCLDCQTRFVTSTVILTDLRFARCPKCARMDLNGWTGKTYNPSFWMRWKATLGAKRWRCEYCRLNFASFRKRREVFTFKRWEKTKAGAARAEGRARVNQLMSDTQGRILVANLSTDAKKPDGDDTTREVRDLKPGA